MKPMVLITALLLWFAAAPVEAQRGEAPSQATIAAASRLLTAMHYDELLDQTTAKLIAQAQSTLPQRIEAQTQQQLPDEIKQQLAQATADYMRRKFAQNRPEMRQSTILIYAHHFTADELDHLAKLQSDPVMAKMQREMPQIATEINAFTQAESERDMPELVAQLKAVIEQYSRPKS